MSLLKALKWFMIDQFMFGVGGGGGGGPTQTTSTVNQNTIPAYAQPYVETMLGTAQQQVYNMTPEGSVTGFKPYVPYSTNMNDYQASFSPMQEQSFKSAANLVTPGQIGAGSTITGAAGLGALGAGANYAAQATNPYAVGAYMNPYLKSALDPQLAEIQRQYGITGTQQQGQATAAGAFGGSREALMAAENQRNKNMAMNKAIGEGYNTAFNSANQNMQFGANLGLQGMGQAGQAGATLGQLGTQQLAAQQGILGTQNTMGAQQQAQEQNKINQAIQNYATEQQYPMMQLGNISNLLHGLPLQSTTTQTYQAAPSVLSQIGGLGATALGAYGAAGGFKAAKEGGVMKSYAQGGIVGYSAGGDVMSQDNAERIAQHLKAAQLEKVQPRTLPDYIRIPLLAQKVEEQKAADAAKAAAQVQQNQPSIKEMVLAQAQGIDTAPTNFPTERMAGGGIVAFDEGGEVPGYAEGVYVAPTNYNPKDAYTQMRQYYTDEELRKKYNPEALPMMGGSGFLDKLQEGKQATKVGKEIGTPYDAAINYYGETSNEAAPLIARRTAWIAGQKDPYTQAPPVGSKYNQLGTASAATTTQEATPAKKEKPAKEVLQRPAEDRPDLTMPADTSKPETVKTLADYAKEFTDYLGANPEKDLAEKRAKKAEDRAAAKEDQNIWNAIMKGGLKTMQGTSPFALANIGAGGEAGLLAYQAGQDVIDNLKDKADDYRSAYAAAERREKLATTKYGADSMQAAQERATKQKIADEHNKTAITVQKMSDANEIKKANIIASAKGEAKPMSVTDRLKLKEVIDTAMQVEEKNILANLGSNAKLPTSKAYPEYVRQMNTARQRVAANAMSGGTSGIPEPAAAAPGASGGIKFLGWES